MRNYKSLKTKITTIKKMTKKEAIDHYSERKGGEKIYITIHLTDFHNGYASQCQTSQYSKV